jgi:hypothetical protein
VDLNTPPHRLTSTSLSNIIASGKVPGFAGFVATLDPIIAKTNTQLNTTSPGSLILVHRM